MKTLIFVLLSFILLSNIFSQDWVRTDLPTPGGNQFYGGIFFVNAYGWCFNMPYTQYFNTNPVQIYKSTDKGVSWNLQTSIDINVCTDVYDRYSTHDGLYFIDQNNGWLSFAINASTCGYQSFIYRTSNGGNNWNPIYHQTWGTDNANDVLWGSFSFLDANTGYMWQGTELGYYRNGLYKTINGGVNWGSNLISMGDNVQCARIYGNTIYYGGVHTYQGTRRPTLFKSIDGGNNFSILADGNTDNSQIGGIQYFSMIKDNNNNDVLMLLTDKGIAILNSDNSFTIRSNPVSGSVNTTGLLEFNNTNYGLLYGVFNVSANNISKLMYTSNAGYSWTDIPNYLGGSVVNLMHLGDIDWAASSYENDGNGNYKNRLYTKLLPYVLNTNFDWNYRLSYSPAYQLNIDGTIYTIDQSNKPENLRAGTMNLSALQPLIPVPNGITDTTAQFYYWGGDLNGSTTPANNADYMIYSNKQINADYKTNLISTDNNILQGANQVKSLKDANGVTNLIYESMGGGIFFTRTRPDLNFKLEENVTAAFENGYKSWGNTNPFISEIKSIGYGVDGEHNIVAAWERPYSDNNGNHISICKAERSTLGYPHWQSLGTTSQFTIDNVPANFRAYPKMFLAENRDQTYLHNILYNYGVLTYLNSNGNINVRCFHYYNNETESDFTLVNENVVEYSIACNISSNGEIFDLYVLYRVGNDMKYNHYQCIYDDGWMPPLNISGEYKQISSLYLDKGEPDISMKDVNNGNSPTNLQPIIAYKGQWNAIFRYPNPAGQGQNPSQDPVTYYTVTWEEKNSPTSWAPSYAIHSTTFQDNINLDGSRLKNSYFVSYEKGGSFYVLVPKWNASTNWGTDFLNKPETDLKLIKSTIEHPINSTQFQLFTLNQSNNVYQLAVAPFNISQNDPNAPPNPDEVTAVAFADNVQYMFNLGSIIVNSTQVNFDVSDDTAIYDVSDMNDCLSSNAFWLNDGDTLIVGRSAFYLPDAGLNFQSVVYSTALMRNSDYSLVCTLDVDTLQVGDSADIEALYGYVISGYGADSFYVELQADTLWNIDSSLIGGASGGFSAITGGGGDNVHRPLKDLVFFKNKIKNPINVVPTVFNLHQNYPNPFNPSTTIKYDIPKATMVTMKVYDILGREVTTLVNEVKQPGYYEAEFNGTNLASGIYFYRIIAGKFTNVKKMVLIK